MYIPIFWMIASIPLLWLAIFGSIGYIFGARSLGECIDRYALKASALTALFIACVFMGYILMWCLDVLVISLPL